MTRDEAIEIIHGVTYPETVNKTCGDACGGDFARDRKWSMRIVDGMAALGILKLDEPKSATEKFKDALIDQGWSPQGVDDAIRQAGVKIVEK